MTAKDGTEYVPIDSVYAIGEIKSTYRKASMPIENFGAEIEDIREKLHHEEILNTAYGSITNETTIIDMVLGKANRILNRLFYFMLFIDSGDFNFEDIGPFYAGHDNKYLPNVTVILNGGIIVRGNLDDKGFGFNLYPEDTRADQEDWYYCPYPGDDSNGSPEGNHLGFLYYSVLEHLTNSYLEPPSLKNYIRSMLVGRKSLLKKASQQINKQSAMDVDQ